MGDGPSFEISDRPIRTIDGRRVQRKGKLVFELIPEARDVGIERAVNQVLQRDEYVFGDWFDLPRPVYLVYDTDRGTVFRAVVADDRVELHVLPSTDSSGLRAFFDRLGSVTNTDWSVKRRSEPP